MNPLEFELIENKIVRILITKNGAGTKSHLRYLLTFTFATYTVTAPTITLITT
ncbi:hypothetical protein RV07_GL001727 [Enterococcus malodoratus]|nr:hypothetical protein RV07_GL001727 [Enterococcus malodoratus]